MVIVGVVAIPNMPAACGYHLLVLAKLTGDGGWLGLVNLYRDQGDGVAAPRLAVSAVLGWKQGS